MTSVVLFDEEEVDYVMVEPDDELMSEHDFDLCDLESFNADDIMDAKSLSSSSGSEWTEETVSETSREESLEATNDNDQDVVVHEEGAASHHAQPSKRPKSHDLTTCSTQMYDHTKSLFALELAMFCKHRNARLALQHWLQERTEPKYGYYFQFQKGDEETAGSSWSSKITKVVTS